MVGGSVNNERERCRVATVLVIYPTTTVEASCVAAVNWSPSIGRKKEEEEERIRLPSFIHYTS